MDIETWLDGYEERLNQKFGRSNKNDRSIKSSPVSKGPPTTIQEWLDVYDAKLEREFGHLKLTAN